MMNLLPLLMAAILQTSPTPMQTVARDMMSRIDAPREAVARTAEEWAALWRQHAGDKPAPQVDFATRAVIAVFLGTRPSAGYAAEITGTRAEGAGLVVEWRERRPEPGMMVAQVLTSPSHIVTIPRVAGPITFEKAGK